MTGTKQIALRTRDGHSIPIGTVTFRPQESGNEGSNEGGTERRTGFKLDLDTTRLTDFFLSMREFKCLEGPEIQCYVPYPYANPRTMTANDLRWLEHSLIFFYKTPTDFGAVLRNGLYYNLRLTEEGLTGTPQAIDLNEIAAPPQDQSIAPYGPESRFDIEPNSRWIEALTIR